MEWLSHLVRYPDSCSCPYEFKKAVKIFCVREGTTEQAWLSELIETELRNKAPDLWSEKLPPTRRSRR